MTAGIMVGDLCLLQRSIAVQSFGARDPAGRAVVPDEGGSRGRHHRHVREAAAAGGVPRQERRLGQLRYREADVAGGGCWP